MRTGVLFTLLILSTQALAGCFGDDEFEKEMIMEDGQVTCLL